MIDGKDIYDLSRCFWDFAFENSERIKPNHAAVYFFAIEQCNRLGWKEKFGLPSGMVMEAVGIRSYNTYIKTFNDLVEFGFFKLIEKSRNQYSSNIIALSKFDKAHTKALDKALIKHVTKHTPKQSESTIQSTGESIDSIIIQTNQDTIKPIYQDTIKPKGEKEFSPDVKKCFDMCLNFFDENLHPAGAEILKWKDTIEKLNRIDKIPFDKIIEIVKFTRADNFWSTNFLTINKLRKKNKDGIMYIVAFNERLKHGKKQTNTGASDEYRRSLAERLKII